MREPVMTGAATAWWALRDREEEVVSVLIDRDIRSSTLQETIETCNPREAAKKVPPLMARPLRGGNGNDKRPLKEENFLEDRWPLSSRRVG